VDAGSPPGDAINQRKERLIHSKTSEVRQERGLTGHNGE
jgi:hypothetical protein